LRLGKVGASLGELVLRWENQEITLTASPSTPGKEKGIDFRTDDGEALLVLNIAHLKFSNVQDHTLHYDLLYKVASLIKLYQCIDLVKSYKTHWVSDSQRQLATAGQQGWFFIAYAFGLDQLFEEAAGKMARELRTNEEGKWYIGDLLLLKTIQVFNSSHPSDILTEEEKFPTLNSRLTRKCSKPVSLNRNLIKTFHRRPLKVVLRSSSDSSSLCRG
jgi:hypothetical protein